jgi:acetylornithine deacetylase
MTTNKLLDPTRDHLAQLIGFPTVSCDSNLDLIHYAQAALDDAGARTTLTYDADRRKANVFGTIGPEVNGGVVLSGHTDVVPAAGQAWDYDPFVAHDNGERIYGRGSCDMKGFIACALALAPEFAAMPLARPVHFAFTYDEETGCLGAPVMLDALREHGPKPSIAIIGEPTSMQIIEGHKGCYEYTTQIVGLEGHGSEPDKGVNAVEYGVRYVSRLIELGKRLRANAPAQSVFDPPWATVSVGHFTGGIARNIIAKECEIEWEMRPVQQGEAEFVMDEITRYVHEELLPAMQEVYPDASLVTRTIGAVGGLEPMLNRAAVELTRKLTGGNSTGVVSFGTEAGLFQEQGIATVVCGPGSIDHAHKPNEFVEHDQLGLCLDMLTRLGNHLQQQPNA